MSEVSVITKGDWEVRTQTIDGKPWFCNNDVCKYLEISNPGNKLKLLKTHEICDIHSVDTIGRTQKTKFISLSGLNKVITSCRKATQEGTAPNRFWCWVCEEVLPSIQTTGQYSLPQDDTQQIDFQLRGLQLREAESRRKDVELVMRLFPNDARMQQHASDFVQNRILSITNGEPANLSVTEVLVETGDYTQKAIRDNSIALGRRVAAQWREDFHNEPEKTYKFVNGNRTRICVYPASYAETIIRIFNEVLQGRPRLAKGQQVLKF